MRLSKIVPHGVLCLNLKSLKNAEVVAALLQIFFIWSEYVLSG